MLRSPPAAVSGQGRHPLHAVGRRRLRGSRTTHAWARGRERRSSSTTTRSSRIQPFRFPVPDGVIRIARYGDLGRWTRKRNHSNDVRSAPFAAHLRQQKSHRRDVKWRETKGGGSRRERAAAQPRRDKCTALPWTNSGPPSHDAHGTSLVSVYNVPSDSQIIVSNRYRYALLYI